METCRSCKAFLQPDWDRCKICGEPRGQAPTADESGGAGAGGSPGSGASPSSSPPGPTGSGESNRAILVGGAVILVLVVVVGVIFTVARDSDGEDEGIVAGADSATTAAPADDPDRADSDELQALCNGEVSTVTPSAPYPGELGPLHPIQVVRVGAARELGYSSSVASVPIGWGVQGPDQRPVELVACVSLTPGGATQPCEGFETNLPVVLESATWTVELRAASTGEVLAAQDMPGTAGCPEGDLYLEPGQRDEVRVYSSPGSGAVTAFVEPFVTG